MTSPEMHVWFRQYAQQMGMQNVRAILPEQIDNLINTATLDVVDEIINTSVGTTNDRIISDNSKLASVNALRTLYRVKSVPVVSEKVSTYGTNPFTFDSDCLDEPLYFVDFSVKYNTDKDIRDFIKYKGNIAEAETLYAAGNALLDAATPEAISQDSDLLDAVYNKYNAAYSKLYSIGLITGDSTGKVANFLIQLGYEEYPDDNYSDFYTAAKALLSDFIDNVNQSADTLNKKVFTTGTRFFPIRVIDDAFLADVLNDWVLAPRMRTPAMVVYGSDEDKSIFELYVGENAEASIRPIANNSYITVIRCSYIKKPRKVVYVSDVTNNLNDNVDSDLPEQLQIPMLKHAVDLYRVSVQGATFIGQNAQQSQQDSNRQVNVPQNQ